MAADLVVTSERVVLPDGVRPAAIHISGGTVTAITERASGPSVLDAAHLVVLPGLVDSHVHVNEPGRTDWEGFTTATRAAAAGGTTTIVDMPLNSIPPTVSRDALVAKQRAARSQCAVDVAFWGGVIPGNGPDLAGLVEEGVAGFKAFLVDSGVPEFPAADDVLLRKILPELAGWGVPLSVHAELADPMAKAQAVFAAQAPADRRSYRTFLDSRPPEAEDEAVRLIVELAAETGAAVHIVHLASGSAVDIVREAKAAGLSVSAETCPHYLTVDTNEIPDGATEFKCCPPIRDASHREALWAGLVDGTIELVVSDHSPSPPELKAIDTGDFAAAWGGIAGLQLRLPLVWTEARRRGIGLELLAEWLAAGPARLAGLDDRKGAIEVGGDADLVIFDPEVDFEVDPAALEHRHPLSPYACRRLHGRVTTTILRGEIVHPATGRLPTGRMLVRSGRSSDHFDTENGTR